MSTLHIQFHCGNKLQIKIENQEDTGKIHNMLKKCLKSELSKGC